MKTELMNKIEEKEYKIELEIIDKKIEDTYKQIYVYSNPKLIMLYYDIGGYINKHKTWGSEYVKRLCNDLKYRKGMSYDNLYRMAKFNNAFTYEEIMAQAVPQIPWGHIVTIMSKCKTKESRLWYIEKTHENSWSRSTLIKQIKAKAYERNQIEPIVSKGVKDYDSSLIEGLIKNSYLLPFTSKDFDNEKDLKDKIINEILNFLKELGKGYALLGKEYEIKTNSSKKFFIDILMYNVILHSYVVIEIKIGDYKPAYYGQLKNYVLLVDEQMKSKMDNKTLGVLICKDGDKHIIKTTFENDNTPLVYAEYILLDKLDEYMKIK